MKYPLTRLRRYRQSKRIQDLFTQTQLSLHNIIYPVFVTEGTKIKKPIPALPEQFIYSIDTLKQYIWMLVEKGLYNFLIFGVPSKKDTFGTGAYTENNIIEETVKELRKTFGQDIVIACDVCLCEYKSDGHCGIVIKTSRGQEIDNDKTLELLGKTALNYALAGADIVSPSDMMDGRVKVIREILDKNNLTNTLIMSYSAKFHSSFYGPFREAAGSAPQFGDRSTYQLNPSNAKEALRECETDFEEGVDILMIKPAGYYLDIILKASETFNLPIAAYNVSGEYTMIKLMAKSGFIDENNAVLETLNSIKRAGADIIITYWANKLLDLI